MSPWWEACCQIAGRFGVQVSCKLVSSLKVLKLGLNLVSLFSSKLSSLPIGFIFAASSVTSNRKDIKSIYGGVSYKWERL